MKEQYEPIKFETWQELAKYVIDGGEVYWFGKNNVPNLVKFHGVRFDADIPVLFKNVDGVLHIKKQPTLEELIAIKPRLCWVWDKIKNSKSIKVVYDYNKRSDHPYLLWNNVGFMNAQMLTDDEIKKFLSDES